MQLPCNKCGGGGCEPCGYTGSNRTRLNRLKRRRTAAALKLSRLCKQQQGRCHWCGHGIVLLDTLPKAAIIRQTAATVQWTADNKIQESLYATVDHITPVAAGGDNKFSNLVAACGPCNRNRTATRTVDLERKTTVCPVCGGPKPKARKKCVCCRRGAARGCPHYAV